MAIVSTVYNISCISCSKLQHEMVKVGPMIFCPKCFNMEFVNTGSYSIGTHNIDRENENYQDWLNVYKKLIDR